MPLFTKLPGNGRSLAFVRLSGLRVFCNSIRCRTDAKLPELKFRALLTEEASKVEVALA
jgi:hypothetical protein